MNASKFSDAQKVRVLKRFNEGRLAEEIVEKVDIDSVTYCNWKKEYGNRPS